MRTCNCALAGTDACKNCNVPDYSEINSINKRRLDFNDNTIFNNKGSYFTVDPYNNKYIEELKKELEDCKKDYCILCKRQSTFNDEWCKECRWNKK